MTDELQDLIDEWHLAREGEALDYSLTGWIAYKLDMTNKEAIWAVYGETAGKPRDDGARLG